MESIALLKQAREAIEGLLKVVESDPLVKKHASAFSEQRAVAKNVINEINKKGY
jgi:hypothetical protein